jgi:hypothetical protein
MISLSLAACHCIAVRKRRGILPCLPVAGGCNFHRTFRSLFLQDDINWWEFTRTSDSLDMSFTRDRLQKQTNVEKGNGSVTLDVVIL